MTTDSDYLYAERNLYNLMVGLGLDDFAYEVGNRCLIVNGHKVDLPRVEDRSDSLYRVDGVNAVDYAAVVDAVIEPR